MPVDPAFVEGSTVGRESFPALKYSRSLGISRSEMRKLSPDRFAITTWVSEQGLLLGGWKVAMDATFGRWDWKGRRNGRRRDLRDGLLVFEKRHRGFDPDDALDLYRKFFDRVAPAVSWVAAVERNPDYAQVNEGNHLHAMLAFQDELYLKRLHDLWVAENGWCKVNFIRSRVESENYCCKHLVKCGYLLGYDFKSADLWAQPGSSL
jgi:hypothetical protein